MTLNPYASAGSHRLRGNIHMHTTASDGAQPMQEVIDDYAGRGYDFLMFSDHDILSDAGTYAGIEDRGLVLVPGNEVTRNGPHMLHVGASQCIEPDENRQAVLDGIAADTGFAVFNHPDWLHHYNHCPYEVLEQSTGFLGIEIFNGVCEHRLGGSGYGLAKWDRLISREGAAPVWGFATDDSHAPVDVGCGWIDVLAQTRDVDGVMAAMRAGAFFASTGVTINAVRVDGRRVTIETADAQRIVAYRNGNHRIAVADATTLTVEAPEKARFVRFDCYGAGESRAWSQPVFFAS